MGHNLKYKHLGTLVIGYEPYALECTLRTAFNIKADSQSIMS